MVGLIQKILVDLILKNSDQQTLEKIKAQANIPMDRDFRIDTVYSDKEWQNFLKATLEVLDISEQEAFELYADAFCSDAMKRFPVWFEMSKNSLEFLKRQPAIHNNFATGVANLEDRDAINDKFDVVVDDDKLTTYYCSDNKHCMLYIALATWVINHYKDEAEITHPECMHHGKDKCKIVIEWSKLNNANK